MSNCSYCGRKTPRQFCSLRCEENMGGYRFVEVEYDFNKIVQKEKKKAEAMDQMFEKFDWLSV